MEPPVIFHPQFLSPSLYESLFPRLRDTVSWNDKMKARKTASFGVPYDYNQMSYEVIMMPPELDEICSLLEEFIGFRPNNCLLNFYPDGDSSVGFHSDSAQNLAQGSGIVILSLGAQRSMLFREKSNKANEHRLELPPGSLLYMSTEMQTDWLHSIPKCNDEDGSIGARISLTFRRIIDNS
jgi:alkylated DNA repair dioxygenase AlkB